MAVMKQTETTANMKIALPAREVFLENSVFFALKGALLRFNDKQIPGELVVRMDFLPDGQASAEASLAANAPFQELAAQVRRLGIVADVQIGDEAISFGDKFDERQVLSAVLATVAALNNIVLSYSVVIPKD